MRTEAEVRERIRELKDLLCDPDTGEIDNKYYLDEEQQSELATLYWVLGDDV